MADQCRVPEVAKTHGISDQTICVWRKRFGTLEPADIKRLRRLELENGRVKEMVADRDRARCPGRPAMRTLAGNIPATGTAGFSLTVSGDLPPGTRQLL
jgi:putative transposase